MIKKIAYLCIFFLSVVIILMAITTEKEVSSGNIIEDQFKDARPQYTDATPEAIFRDELDSKNNG